jgi:hypothetical protein
MTKRKSEKRQTLVKMKQHRNNKLPNVSKEINFAYMLFYFLKWGIIKVSKSGERFCDTFSNKSKL